MNIIVPELTTLAEERIIRRGGVNRGKEIILNEVIVKHFKTDNGKQWFALKDICKMLGVKNVTQTKVQIRGELCNEYLQTSSGAQICLCVELEAVVRYLLNGRRTKCMDNYLRFVRTFGRPEHQPLDFKEALVSGFR